MRQAWLATACVALSTWCFGCTTTVSAGAGISPPAGCSTDNSLACVGGGDGWRCSAGDNPENEVSGLSCSVPQADADGVSDDFCCISWRYATTTCTPDDQLTAVCQYPSFGYTCAIGDNPTSIDSALNCSQPVADPNGTSDDFCCE